MRSRALKLMAVCTVALAALAVANADSISRYIRMTRM